MVAGYGGWQEGGADLDRQRASAGHRSHPDRRRNRAARRDSDERLWADEQAEAVPQGGAGAVEELADGAVAGAETAGDLLIAAALELAHHERVALAFGQRLDRRDHLAELLAPLDLVVFDESRRVDTAVGRPGVGGPIAEQVHGRVVRHRVEPRADVAHLVSSGQRRVRPDERVLDSLLGVAVADDPGAVGDQRAPVADHDQLERGLRPLGDELRQPLIGLLFQNRAPQPRTRQQPGIHSTASLGPPR